MSFQVIATPGFQKDIKKLIKKYPSLVEEYFELVSILEKEPKQGISLGNECYKVRIAIASKGKGKSGGSRVITHLRINTESVYLMAIFDKSDKESLTDKELKALLSALK